MYRDTLELIWLQPFASFLKCSVSSTSNRAAWLFVSSLQLASAEQAFSILGLMKLHGFVETPSCYRLFQDELRYRQVLSLLHKQEEIRLVLQTEPQSNMLHHLPCIFFRSAFRHRRHVDPRSTLMIACSVGLHSNGFKFHVHAAVHCWHWVGYRVLYCREEVWSDRCGREGEGRILGDLHCVNLRSDSCLVPSASSCETRTMDTNGMLQMMQVMEQASAETLGMHETSNLQTLQNRTHQRVGAMSRLSKSAIADPLCKHLCPCCCHVHTE